MTATQLEQLYNLSTKPSNIQNRQVTPNLRPNRTFSNSATAIHESDGSSSNAAAHSTKTNDKADGWNTPRKTSPNKTTNDNWSIETTNNKFALPCSDTNKDESQDDLSASLNTSTIDAQDLEDDQEQLNASQNIINNSSKPTAKPPLLSTWITNQANIFRCKLLTPAAPTFPRAGSFLDLCIADCRLAFPLLINSKLPTSRYDSDHKAIILNVVLPAEVHCIPPALSPNIKIYKKTNWKKFNKTLTSKYTDVIPDDRNLSNA